MASISGPQSFRRLQWLFPFAVTIHNAEEALLLPRWAASRAAEIPWQIPATEFRIGAAILTVGASVITWRNSRNARKGIWTYLFVSYATAMWLNVFVPHVPAVLWFHSYVPGAASAVLIVLPITTALLVVALREHVVPTGATSFLVFGVPLAIAAAVSALVIARLR